MSPPPPYAPRLALALALALASLGGSACLVRDEEPADDDSAPQDDDSTPSDDDTTPADDDTAPADDDTADDDTADDDTADDDTTPEDDDTTPEPVDADGDGWPEAEDCDDADPAVHPGADDGCDGVLDNDCDGATDPLESDIDGDGASPCTGDCDDADPAAFPGAAEVCDGADNDCDWAVDEGMPYAWFSADADGDGFGDPATSYLSCLPDPPAGWVRDASDCDDADAAIHPGAAPACDGVSDRDCDGASDVPPPGWATDPSGWERVQDLGTAERAEYPDALVVSPADGRAVIVTSRWSEGFVDTEVVLYREDGAGSFVEEATYADPSGTVFAQAAAFDGDGTLWIVGYRFVGIGDFDETRVLLLSYDPGTASFTALDPVDATRSAEGASDVGFDGTALWVAGWSVDSAGRERWNAWRMEPGGPWELVDDFGLSDLPTSGVFVRALAVSPDGQVWVVGHAEDDLDVFHPLVRRGGEGGFETVLDALDTPGTDRWERLEDVAVSKEGEVWIPYSRYTPDFSAPTGWTVIHGWADDPSTLEAVDSFELAEGLPTVAWSVAAHPTAGAFVGGEARAEDGRYHDVVRAGPAGAMGTSLDEAAGAGILSGVWEVEVDGEGAVWGLSYWGEEDLFPVGVAVRRLPCP